MHSDSHPGFRRRYLWLNLGLTGVSLLALPMAYSYIKSTLTGDPFSSIFEKKSTDIDDTIGIRMDGVELRAYSGAKLVSSSFANRVDVRRDRQSVALYGVSKGYYTSSQGPITYSANNAVWNFSTNEVTVTKRVDVHGKDFDLKAKKLVYNDRTNLLKIDGDITGRVFKGQVQATTLRYDLKSGAAEVGPVDWKGELSLDEMQDNQVTPRKWDIHGSHMKSLGNNTDIYIYEKSVATDGEIILAAPLVEHNRKSDVVTATGGIQYFSAKADIIADKCVVYRKEKRAVLTGHVTMFFKPKAQENDPPKIEKLPDFKPVKPEQVVPKTPTGPVDKDTRKAMEDEIRSSKNMRDYPMVVVSDQIEYWYAKGSRHAKITGNPQGRQTLKDDNWRHIWSHEAFYDGEKEQLQLVSTPKSKDTFMKNSLGDLIHAIDITVSTKEGDDQMDCTDPEASLSIADDEIPRDDKKKDDKSVPPPTKAGGGGGGKASFRRA